MSNESGSSPQNAGRTRAPKNTERTGEFREAALLTKATGLGFKVAKHWGDSEIIRARAREVRAACMPSPMRRFYPDGACCSRFERYREAWHPLAEPRKQNRIPKRTS